MYVIIFLPTKKAIGILILNNHDFAGKSIEIIHRAIVMGGNHTKKGEKAPQFDPSAAVVIEMLLSRVLSQLCLVSLDRPYDACHEEMASLRPNLEREGP